MSKIKLGIVGCGYLGNIIVDAYNRGLLEEYEIVGVMGRDALRAEAMAGKAGCQVCDDIEALLQKKPEYIAEAASGQIVKDIANKVLANGANLIVLSIGAFADSDFYEEVKNTARKYGTKVHIASGAIGGFDVLRTISLMGAVETEFETRKGPASLVGTSIFEDHLMTDTEESMVLEGNAKKAISLLPTRVNVAVAAALASAGTQDTQVKIHNVPGMVGDDHKITAKIDGVEAVIDIYSATSEIAGWSVVALLRNLVSPIVF